MMPALKINQNVQGRAEARTRMQIHRALQVRDWAFLVIFRGVHE
jgi:hypothetical protein